MRRFICTLLFSLLCLNGPLYSASLNIGMLHLPSSVNPSKYKTSRDYRVVLDLYEGLIAVDKQGMPIPGLASRWHVDESATRYHFTLRDNLRWSDGHPLVAGDFVTSWQSVVKHNIQSTNILRILKNGLKVERGELPPSALGVSAPDDKTLVLELESPIAFLEKQLSQPEFMPLPMHAIDLQQLTQEWPVSSDFPTSGPYMFSRNADKALTLAKNPFYHAAAQVNFDQLNYLDYEGSEGRMLNDLIKDKIAIAEIGSNSRQLEWLKNTYPQRLKYVGIPVLTYLTFNSDDETVADPRVRRALDIAIDKNILAKALTNSVSKYSVAHSIAPPEMYQQADTLIPPWYDIAAKERHISAVKLLRDAGYSSQKPLKIALHVDSREHRTKLGKLLQGMWERVGVQTQLSILPPEQHYADLHNNKQQLSLSGWGQDYREPYNFLSILDSDFYGERPIASKTINTLLERALFTVSDLAREKIYLDIERTNRDQVIRLPLTFSRDANLVSPRLEGYEYTGSMGHPSRWLHWKR